MHGVPLLTNQGAGIIAANIDSVHAHTRRRPATIRYIAQCGVACLLPIRATTLSSLGDSPHTALQLHIESQCHAGSVSATATLSFKCMPAQWNSQTTHRPLT